MCMDLHCRLCCALRMDAVKANCQASRKRQRTAAASKSARLLRLVLAQARGLRPGDMRVDPSRKAGPPPPPPLYGLSALALRMLPFWVGLPGLMLLMTPMPAHRVCRPGSRLTREGKCT